MHKSINAELEQEEQVDSLRAKIKQSVSGERAEQVD